MLKIIIISVSSFDTKKTIQQIKNRIDNALDIASSVECSSFVNLPNNKSAFMTSKNRSPFMIVICFANLNTKQL